jgi:predicted transposase/invertase (TIGR01784 family)
LYDWAKFINAKTEEELAMLAERNPQIGKAVVKLRQLSADERTRDLYERREKARRDMESQTRWGILQSKYEIARNALKMGLSMNDIVTLTGLTPDEVKNLKQ